MSDSGEFLGRRLTRLPPVPCTVGTFAFAEILRMLAPAELLARVHVRPAADAAKLQVVKGS
jgi:hypothetical protein